MKIVHCWWVGLSAVLLWTPSYGAEPIAKDRSLFSGAAWWQYHNVTPPLLSRSVLKDIGSLTSEPRGNPFPDGGVLFGEPPEDEWSLNFGAPTVEPRSNIIAEYEVGDGFVRFLDEGDSVSTIVKGGFETFKSISGASTVGELFDMVAPKSTSIPVEIAKVINEPLEAMVAAGGIAEGPTLEHEFTFGDDDWANGCARDAVDQWEIQFNNWHGPLGWADDRFSTTGYYDFGPGVIDDLTLWGYFGNLDEIWFGVCIVQGGRAWVQMEHYTGIGNAGGTPLPSGGYSYGTWRTTKGTKAYLAPGERYLYHNHSIYSALRRGVIDPWTVIDQDGWELFISGAGSDAFDPDDQLQSAD